MIPPVQVAVSNMLSRIRKFLHYRHAWGDFRWACRRWLNCITFINKVERYGYKDAFNYFKLQTREVSEGVDRAVQKKHEKLRQLALRWITKSD